MNVWKRLQTQRDEGSAVLPASDHTGEVVPVDDPSLARAHYAEALTELESEHPTAMADGGRNGYERFRSWLELQARGQGSDHLAALVRRLGEPPFSTEEDFAPELHEQITGVVDTRRGRGVLHLRPRCPARGRGPGERFDGRAAQVLSDPSVSACEECAGEVAAVARWADRRLRWVQLRHGLVAMAAEMQEGGPARPDTVWTVVSGLGRWLGLRGRVALKVVNQMARISADRSAASGARKAAAFDAALYVALHRAGQAAESASDHADLVAMRDALGDDHRIDRLVDEATRRRSWSSLTRGQVRKRMEVHLDAAMKDATELHGELHARTGPVPAHLNGVGTAIPLVRRVAVTHGIRVRDAAWMGSISSTEPPAGAVAEMVEAAKAVHRAR